MFPIKRNWNYFKGHRCFYTNHLADVTHLHVFVDYFTHGYSIIEAMGAMHVLRLTLIKRKEIFPPISASWIRN